MYRDIAIAPPRASMLPFNEFVIEKLSPTTRIIHPTMDNTVPNINGFVSGSFRMKVEPRATTTGFIVTRTNELATEVVLRDVIQKAKWSARKKPAHQTDFQLIDFNRKAPVIGAMSQRKNAAINILAAATTSAGASAIFISAAAEEIDKTLIVSAAKRTFREGCLNGSIQRPLR